MWNKRYLALLGAYALGVAFVSLRPVDTSSLNSLDKVFHLAIYALFALIASRAVRQETAFQLVCVAIVAFGGILEVLQSAVPGRMMSLADFAANSIGVLLAMLLTGWQRRRAGARTGNGDSKA